MASLFHATREMKLSATDDYYRYYSFPYAWKRKMRNDYDGWTQCLDRVEKVYIALQLSLTITHSATQSSAKTHASDPEPFGFTPLQNMILLPHHYHRQAPKNLIESGNIDLNDCGLTPGWSPLWLSIISGGSILMYDLLRQKCFPKVASATGAGSVIHVLNQLDKKDVRPVLKMILRSNDAVSGLTYLFAKMIGIGNSTRAIEDRVNDLTPLLATFVGWDYSDGEATRALLDLGANPTASIAHEGLEASAIVLCMRTLDHGLLEHMLSSPWAMQNNDERGRTAIAKAKVNAFRHLITHTKFYYVSILGGDFDDSLKRCLNLLIDDEMLVQLNVDNLKYAPQVNTSPLGSSLYHSKPFVAEALLKIYDDKNFEFLVKETPHLLTAIERQQRKIASLLIRKGASPMETGVAGFNAFHTAAMHFPAFLPELLNLAAETNLCENTGKSMKEILQLNTEQGNDVISLLLLEGYEAEFSVAEQLLNYGLEVNIPRYDLGGEVLWTLAAFAVYMTARQAVTPLTQLNFILNLDPRPEMICSNKGDTLFEIAMTGLKPGSEFFTYLE